MHNGASNPFKTVHKHLSTDNSTDTDLIMPVSCDCKSYSLQNLSISETSNSLELIDIRGGERERECTLKWHETILCN